MIEVELPDGSIAEFPDGTGNDVIKSALQKRFGAPQAAAQQEATDPRNSMLGKADAFMRGAADTLSLGFADEIAAGLGTGFGYLGDYDQELARQRGTDAEDAENRFGYRLGGQLSGGLAGAAGLARSGASLSANAAMAGHGLGRTASASALEGALLGGAHGLGSGEDAEGRISQALTGAKWGGVLGGAAPYAISGLSAGARKLATPFATSPERTAAADLLSREGIPLTAGQRTGSRGLRYAESELGGAKTADLLERQSEAFTDAAMRRAGGGGRATSDNMAAMADRLGKGFEGISARNAVKVDRGILDDMNAAAREYGRVLPTEQRSIFNQLGDEIIEKFKAGKNSISGEDYQTIRSRLSRMAKNNKTNDPEFASALRGLRDALDNGMERSVNPADAGAWAELRRQYGNMKTLERAATGGGENSALGLISPAQLRMAASSGNRGAYARGQGDFSELAKAGQAAMTPLPDSGTASRLAIRGLLSAPAAAGAIAGGASGDVLTGLAGAAAGAAVPKVAGALMMSGPVQRYLSNQAITGALSPEMRAIANILINSEGSAAAGRLGP